MPALRSLLNRFITSPVSVLGNAVRTSVVSLTMSMHIRAANAWRDLFNPLRGLTMHRAVCYLEEGERGAYADLQWCFRYIEKRDAVLRGGKRSLLGAITEMEWDIKTVEEKRLPKGYTSAQAEAQAATLRTAYDAITNLPEALEFLGLAEFRGFSHLEKIIGATGAVVELRPVEQWYWCRDGHHCEWRYNPTAQAGLVRGEEVDLGRFIIREIDDPINEIALIAFVRKQLGRKDEDGFIESFGIPSIFAILPQNVPSDKVAEYQDLADQVISDSRGTLPYGSDIKTLDAGARGVAPFRAFQDALDKEIVMAITSGQLTMLAESGSGTLAGGAHSDTFLRVARSLARRITATLQAQFDLAVLSAAHPGQPPLAYFEILTNQETDVGEVVKDVASLQSAGYAVDASWLEERTGYPVLPAPSTPPASPVPPDQFATAATNSLRAAGVEDLGPLLNRIQDAITATTTDAELQRELCLITLDLPGLVGVDLANTTALQSAWRGILESTFPPKA